MALSQDQINKMDSVLSSDRISEMDRIVSGDVKKLSPGEEALKFIGKATPYVTTTAAGVVSTPFRAIPGVGRAISSATTGIGETLGQQMKYQAEKVAEGDTSAPFSDPNYVQGMIQDPIVKGLKTAGTSLALDVALDNPATRAVKKALADNIVTKTIKGVVNDVLPKAKDNFQAIFRLPGSKKVYDRIKPEVVAEEMVQHNLAGKTLDEMKAVADSVTGRNGIMPKITREVVDSIKDPIDSANAVQQANEALKTAVNIDKESGKKIILKIQKIIDNNIIDPSGKKVPLDVFQSMKDLEDMAYSAIKKGTDAQGAVSATAEDQAEIYLIAADALKEQLKKNITPEAMKKIKERYADAIGTMVSEKARNDFLKINSLEGFRTFQKNWVRLNQMIDYTKFYQNSAMVKSLREGQGIIPRIINAVSNSAPLRSGFAQAQSRAEQSSGTQVFDFLKKATIPAVSSTITNTE